MALYLQRVDTTLVSLDYRKLETAYADSFTETRQATQFVHDQTTNRVVLLVAELTLKIFVEVLYTS